MSREKIDEICNLARESGWDVEDRGWQADDSWIIDLYGGLDDGEKVRIRVYYRRSKSTRDWLFRKGVADYPNHGVQNQITALRRLRHLIKAYGPKKGST